MLAGTNHYSEKIVLILSCLFRLFILIIEILKEEKIIEYTDAS